MSSLLIFSQTTKRAVWPPFVVLFALAALLTLQAAALLAESHRVEHYDATIAEANKALRLVVDAETGERGYLIGGKPLFLAPYHSAQQRIAADLANLKDQVADSPQQKQRVQLILAAYQAWAAHAQEEMKLYEQDNRQAARLSSSVASPALGSSANPPAFVPYFNQAKGKVQMDHLRDLFAEFIDREQQLRDASDHAVQKQTIAAFWVGGTCIVVAAVLLSFTTRRGLLDLSRGYESLLAAEQQARERLGTTLTSIGDAVLVTDALGSVTLMNPVAVALTGWSQEEALGKSARIVFDIVNETTRAVVESPVDRVIRDGVIVGLANHTVLRRRDGTEISIDDSGAPVRDSQGNLVNVVLVFRDITERREIERREHRIAEQLQEALIPKHPEQVPGLSIRGFYRAALQEAGVGGDFSDVFALYPDGNTEERGACTCLVVADLAGKGLAAASQVATVRNMLRYALHREDGSLASAVTRLNQVLAEQNLLTGFATLFVGAYDVRSRILTYVNCGQEPGLLWRAASGVLEQLDPTGPVLGGFQEGLYQEATTSLLPGDVLALFSDGMTEIGPSRRQNLEIEGLIDLFAHCCAAAASRHAATAAEASASHDSFAISVVTDLISAAEAYAGGTSGIKDDIALLVAVAHM